MCTTAGTVPLALASPGGMAGEGWLSTKLASMVAKFTGWVTALEESRR